MGNNEVAENNLADNSMTASEWGLTCSEMNGVPLVYDEESGEPFTFRLPTDHFSYGLAMGSNMDMELCERVSPLLLLMGGLPLELT